MNELITIDPENMDLQPIALFQAGGTEDLISKIEAEARAMVADVTTGRGRKAIASNAAKVARSKTYLDGLGKDLVSGLKAQTKAVDAERREMRTRLDALKVEVRKPLTDFEQAEKDRVARLEERLCVFDFALPTALPDLKSMQTAIRAVDIDESWQEFKYLAGGRRAECLELLKSAIDVEEQRIVAETQMLEAQEKERAEREESIRAEAAEKARKEAEERIAAIEKANKEAEERAARESEEKIAAIEKANREAEARATREAEEKIAAIEKANKEADARAAREAELEKRRAANKVHQASVNRKAAAAIVAIGVDADTAKKLVVAIALGKIANVTITY